MSRSYSAIDPADQEALHTAFKAWCDAGDPFLAKLDRIEAHCRAKLQEVGITCDGSALLIGPRKGEEDTPDGYAIRAFNLLRLLRRFMDPENANTRIAADLAFDLGALLAEAGLKPEADIAFRSGVGRRKAARDPDTKRRLRNSQIIEAYHKAAAHGTPRKRLIAKLEEEFSLSERQIRQIIPSARRK